MNKAETILMEIKDFIDKRDIDAAAICVFTEDMPAAAVKGDFDCCAGACYALIQELLEKCPDEEIKARFRMHTLALILDPKDFIKMGRAS